MSCLASTACRLQWTAQPQIRRRSPILRLRHLGRRRRRSPQASIASAQEQPRRLLARRVNGIFLADFEQGEIGPDLFRHACLMGLEGLVSKEKNGLNVVGANGK